MEAPLLVLECLSHLAAASSGDSRGGAHATGLWRRAHVAFGETADRAGELGLSREWGVRVCVRGGQWEAGCSLGQCLVCVGGANRHPFWFVCITNRASRASLPARPGMWSLLDPSTMAPSQVRLLVMGLGWTITQRRRARGACWGACCNCPPCSPRTLCPQALKQITAHLPPRRLCATTRRWPAGRWPLPPPRAAAWASCCAPTSPTGEPRFSGLRCSSAAEYLPSPACVGASPLQIRCRLPAMACLHPHSAPVHAARSWSKEVC